MYWNLSVIMIEKSTLVKRDLPIGRVFPMDLESLGDNPITWGAVGELPYI
jgi:hypothetical protein